MLKLVVAVFCLFGLASALADPILRKPQSGPRYQHARDSEGRYHLVDTWVKMSDIAEAARYEPRNDNVYHLYTRANPTLSQPLVQDNQIAVQASNFDATKKTVVLLHGWRDGGITSNFVAVLVNAYLEAEDVNVIVVDWSAGSSSLNYNVVLINTVESGRAVAGFINWLNLTFDAWAYDYHIVGHNLGGHQAGVVGRNVVGQVGYITGLDPSLVGWINNPDRFLPDDGFYTEVIHTNCGINGYLSDLAQVDFYPNGGESMPGCESHACDHDRSYFYFAESLTSGGFTGTRCISYFAALLQTCNASDETLKMGGLTPKFGNTGVYLLFTNPSPPFSLG